MRYKEVREVFWRTGCRKQVLRVLVVAPIPYRVPGRRKKGYRVQPFPFDIPAVTGARAFLGFTGGTGGLSANQDILSWEFTSV